MNLQQNIEATIYDFTLNNMPAGRTAKRIMQLIKEDRSPQAGSEAVSAELALLAGQCPDCNGKDLTWDYVNSGSQFFLGCNACSATVKVVTIDKIAALLNKLAPQS